jgi:hypothetical protein
MATEMFGPALVSLGDQPWAVLPPQAFQRYLREHKLPERDTASAISVDALDKLAPELRSADVMVLRLGSPDGERHAHFSLIRAAGRLKDFFLIDAEIFGDTAPITFLPDVSVRSLYPYSVIPEFTETTLVNLAFASGSIGYALGLDLPFPVAAPATGHSTYSFTFLPHSGAPMELRHDNGQVEIDAVFIGRRGGQDILFVVEAKVGKPSTLAKHKLVYPVLALAAHVPRDLPIVPVYVRATSDDRAARYHVVECEFPDPRSHPPSLDGLRARRHSFLSVPLPR